MPLLRCELAFGSGGRGESGEICFGENAWVQSVSVERRDQRGSFAHDANPRVMMAPIFRTPQSVPTSPAHPPGHRPFECPPGCRDRRDCHSGCLARHCKNRGRQRHLRLPVMKYPGLRWPHRRRHWIPFCGSAALPELRAPGPAIP